MESGAPPSAQEQATANISAARAAQRHQDEGTHRQRDQHADEAQQVAECKQGEDDCQGVEADALAHEPGFVGYQAVATGERTVMTISVFRNEEDAELSMEIAAQWVAENLIDYEVERVGAITGEVMVSRAAAEMLVPAHH